MEKVQHKLHPPLEKKVYGITEQQRNELLELNKRNEDYRRLRKRNTDQICESLSQNRDHIQALSELGFYGCRMKHGSEMTHPEEWKMVLTLV